MAKNKIKLLGDLEEEIMEIVWRTGRVSVRDVLLTLQKKKPIAYTTVMTVMARLYKKNLLKRKLDKSNAFVYAPVKSKQDFMEIASAKMIRGFLKEYGDIAVAQFLDILETSDAKKSEEWKNKLREFIK